MVLTVEALREKIYNVLDGVLETGIPVVIERNGRRLKIIAENPPSKLDNLVDRTDAVTGELDDIARIGFTMDGEWYLKPEDSVLGPDDSNLNPDGTRR